MDGFIAFCGWTILVFMLSFGAGVRTDVQAATVAKASSLCANNGGLRSLDGVEATCINGATFDLKATP